MFSLPSLQNVFQRQKFLYLTVLFLAITFATITSAEDNPKEFTAVPWGHRCKIPNKGENIKPSERCDESRGIECQKYTQGNYCGCRQESAETHSYDHESKECRLKVGQFCHFINVATHPHAYEKLAFNAKCHERAECKNVRLISKQESHNNITSDDMTCTCKEGYIPSKDLSQCEDPNHNSSQPQPHSSYAYASTTTNNVLYGLGLALLFLINTD